MKFSRNDSAFTKQRQLLVGVASIFTALLLVILSQLQAEPMLPQTSQLESMAQAIEDQKFSAAVNNPLFLESNPKNVAGALLMMKKERQAQGQKVTFYQIGANDGIMNDVLYPVTSTDKAAYIGLLVEPQPTLFGLLTKLHDDIKHLWTFYNGLIVQTCTNGTSSFCESATPGQGNFKTQGQLNGVRDDCGNMVRTTRTCVGDHYELLQLGNAAFQQATKQADGRYWVDMVQIDTEGKDYELIQMFEKSQIGFTCINYEASYMGHPNKSPKRNETMKKLQTLGNFTVIDHASHDVLACQLKQ